MKEQAPDRSGAGGSALALHVHQPEFGGVRIGARDAIKCSRRAGLVAGAGERLAETKVGEVLVGTLRKRLPVKRRSSRIIAGAVITVTDAQICAGNCCPLFGRG